MAGFVASGGIGSENRGAANIVLDAGAGANRAAVVFIAYWDDGASRTFTITAGGIAAGAPVAQVGNASDGLILAYVIPGIPAGEITVSVTPSQTLAEGFFLVSTWDSVPQASPVVDSAIIAGNTGSSINIPAMTVGANEVGVGALYYYVVGASNPVASDTAMGTPFTAGISHSTHQRGDGTLGWTGLGTGGGSMAVGIVLGHDDGAAEPDPPTIVSVDDDNTITSDQTDVGIAGSDFDSATVEIRQGLVTVAQSIDSQSATAIQFDVAFDVSPSASLRHGAATLAVINQDDQEDTIGITIEPPSGHLYVDIATPDTEADNRITAVPDIESGDQIQARGEGGGSVPTGLTLNDDGTFEFSSGNTPSAFDVRVWDVNDATWGDWATQSVGEELDETLIAGASEASGRSLTLSLGASLTLQTGDVEAASRALALSAGLSVAMERGSATAQGREISVQTGASADVSLQRGVAESAGRATAVSAGLAVTLERGAAQAAGREIVPEAGGEVGVLLQRGSALARGRQLEPQHGHSLELARGSSRAVGRQLTVIVGDAAEVTLERGSADAEGRTLAVAAAAGPRLARGNASAVGRSLVPLHGQSITLARGSATARGRVLSVFTGIVLQTPVLRPRSRSVTAGRSSVSKTPRYSSRKV